MKCFRWISFLYTCVFILSHAEPCFSIIVADIDEVNIYHTVNRKRIQIETEGELKQDPSAADIPEEEVKLSSFLRVIFFDTERQEINQDVRYLSASQDHEEQRYSFPGWFAINYTNKAGKPNYSIDLSGFKGKDKLVRYNGTKKCLNAAEYLLKDAQQVVDTLQPNQKYFTEGAVFPLSQTHKKASEIQDFLSKYQKRRKTNVYLQARHCFFDGLDSKFKIDLAPIRKDELGVIGEMATDMTMQWLGFSKRDGKYKGNSNNGFDGVYVRAKDQLLVLSETKFHVKAPNVDAVMKKELCANITSRLENIKTYGSEQQKETGALIQSYFDDAHTVLLLAYVVIPDGYVKSLASPYEAVTEKMSPTKKKPEKISSPDDIAAKLMAQFTEESLKGETQKDQFIKIMASFQAYYSKATNTDPHEVARLVKDKVDGKDQKKEEKKEAKKK